MRLVIRERSEPLSDKLGGEICIATRACMYLSIIESERSEHTVVLSLRLYNYSVTKILLKREGWV